jgi:Uma2 family endonuclease
MIVTGLTQTKLMTGDELLTMPDLSPCELIDGEIVPMSPSGSEPGRIAIKLGRYLDTFVEDRQLGWVTGGEAGLYTRRNPDRVRGVDLAFISKDRLPNGLPAGYLEVAPELIIEIISPHDRWSEVRARLEEYFAIGVQRVWVVEPERRTVLVYRSSLDMSEFREGDTLMGEGVLDGFTLAVASIF